MLIVHVSPTLFTHESRVLRECAELKRLAPNAEIAVLAMNDESESLPATEKINGIQVDRVGAGKWRFRGSLLITRGLEIIKYLWRKKPSIVFVHFVGLLPFVVPVRLVRKFQIVYDAHELETESMSLAGSSKRKRIMKVIEKMSMPFVRHTLTVSPGIKDWYQKVYPNASIILVPNYPKSGDTEVTLSIHDRLGIDRSAKVVLYLGGMTMGRGIELILDVASTFDDKDVVFVFVGYGDKESLVRKASEENANVFFLPPVPPGEVLPLARSAHVGLCLIEPLCLSYHHCYPNKMFEYTAARIPVIVSNLPDMSEFVTNYDAGLVAELSGESLKQAIQQAVSVPKDAWYERTLPAAQQANWETAAVQFRSAMQPLIAAATQ